MDKQSADSVLALFNEVIPNYQPHSEKITHRCSAVPCAYSLNNVQKQFLLFIMDSSVSLFLHGLTFDRLFPVDFKPVSRYVVKGMGIKVPRSLVKYQPPTVQNIIST